MHRLLERQLKALSLSKDESPRSSSDWQTFLTRVDRVYSDSDSDHYLLERSLAISSLEMKERYVQLQQSTRRLESLLEAVPDTILRMSVDGRYLDIRAQPDQLMMPADQLLKLTLQETMPNEAERLLAIYREVCATGKPHTTFSTVEINGVANEFEGRVARFSNTEVTVLVRNITERVKAIRDRESLQMQLVQSAKLASLGTMATGIAHELNNPLAAVNGFAQALKATHAADPKSLDRCEKILKATERMQKIIMHLLEFAREGRSSAPAPVALNGVVHDAFILLRAQINNLGIQIELDLAEALPPVFGDKNRLESVVQNFLVNARDALGEVDMAKRKITVRTRLEAGKVMLQVSDTGCGMSEETRARMFDPFFTTKAPGKGTGLGMSIVSGIVADHHGEIFVRSQLGVGSTVTCLFPPSGGVATVPIAAASADVSVPSAKLRMLIVDDEPDICEILADVFGTSYHVDTELDARSAAKRLATGVYDIIVTDVLMPAISGMEIVVAARRANPRTIVFVTSGHAIGNEYVERALSAGAAALIPKPFMDYPELLALVASKIGKKLSA